MGLIHPWSLAEWHRWQRAQQSLGRRARSVAAGAVAGDRARPASWVLTRANDRGGHIPRVLVALDSRSPTSVRALLEPLRHLPPEEVAVLSPESVTDLLPTEEWTEASPSEADLRGLLTGTEVVLSTGHYLPVGAFAQSLVSDPDRFAIVQHGLLTPHAPPLAEGASLLAWTSRDAAFWGSGRPDVSVEVVGSQLLWDAAATASTPGTTRPLFLGQLHAAELPRATLVTAVEDFCGREHAAYRPHPSETDRRSRRTHARWERRGVVVDRSGRPLLATSGPVVSVFSTGVLEAAAAGRDAWVTCPEPPSWLREFWARYGLGEWGGPPTPPPERPATSPAEAVARWVTRQWGRQPS